MRSIFLAAPLALCASIAPALAQSEVGIRILLGVTDQKSTKWDGSITVRGAEVRSIEPWRFEPEDSINGSTWKIATHAARLFNNGSQMGLFAPVIVPNGLIVRLSSNVPTIELAVKTSQGNFTVRLADLPYGKFVYALNGRASVYLVPPSSQLTNDPEEQDVPAATVAKDGTIWLGLA